MITAAMSDAALKDRLKNARRIGNKIPESHIENVRRMIQKGTSKKMICTVYSITYETLKEQLK